LRLRLHAFIGPRFNYLKINPAPLKYFKFVVKPGGLQRENKASFIYYPTSEGSSRREIALGLARGLVH
jgi:hypothetical protein